MREIVINTRFGGFGLSKQAATLLGLEIVKARYGIFHVMGEEDISRDDPKLIKVVRSLGRKANGPHADLRIISIPNSVKWHIENYDGREWVAEDHRTWRYNSKKW